MAIEARGTIRVPLGPDHTRPCVETLDAYHRCVQCLSAAGRPPDSPWLSGDEYYVPPRLRSQARVH